MIPGDLLRSPTGSGIWRRRESNPRKVPGDTTYRCRRPTTPSLPWKTGLHGVARRCIDSASRAGVSHATNAARVSDGEQVRRGRCSPDVPRRVSREPSHEPRRGGREGKAPGTKQWRAAG
jgi:hypothetical protein